MSKGSFQTVVRIEITDSKRSNKESLITKFLNFATENQVFPACRGGHAGGREYIGYYTKEDAEKIKMWLKQQKAKVFE